MNFSGVDILEYICMNEYSWCYWMIPNTKVQVVFSSLRMNAYIYMITDAQWNFSSIETSEKNQYWKIDWKYKKETCWDVEEEEGEEMCRRKELTNHIDTQANQFFIL